MISLKMITKMTRPSLNIAMPDSDNPTEQAGIADGAEEGSLDHP